MSYEEYVSRLATIVKAFNKLTAEEKLDLKNYLANTLSKEMKEEGKTKLPIEKNKRVK